ncbi:hypothetical protein ACJRO7_030097 [Eucalyptus globulus]|uniref:FAR1 domain-containing protein n=1 Tax=Eucalyptus globulus TaxID=34317 RepID=A0ABD3JE01_EUCGL
MDLEEEASENPVKGENGDQEENAISEPYMGMEFDSEEAARKFYIDYARQVGFVVRIMQRRRSGIDGRTLARRLGCNKQGFSPNQKGSHGPDKKPWPSAREGCKATILVKMEKSGKWVVTRFVKDHNHPLVVTANGFGTMVSLPFSPVACGCWSDGLFICNISTCHKMPETSLIFL